MLLHILSKGQLIKIFNPTAVSNVDRPRFDSRAPQCTRFEI